MNPKIKLSVAFLLIVIILLGYSLTRSPVVETGDTVAVNITLSINGVIVDTTIKDIAERVGIFEANKSYEPLVTVVGSGELPIGLEETLLGMKQREIKIVELPPEKAFGYWTEDYIQWISREDFIKEFGLQPEEGKRVAGRGQSFLIRKITEDRVLIDFNHPFAADPELVIPMSLEEFLGEIGTEPVLGMTIKDSLGRTARVVKIEEMQVFLDFNPLYVFKIEIVSIKKS
ncbi:MAG: peptidylprolyl isomerase [Candidatus Methanofastidiosia archaeon]